MRQIGVGLFGSHGHQIHGLLRNHERATCVAVADFAVTGLPAESRSGLGVKEHGDLDGLLGDPRVELVAFCSARRRDQADHVVNCLQAGKHAYAEKPCAMTEDDLDRIIEAASESGRVFHEMAGTAFAQPYLAMRDLVANGVIGEVIQVLAQKSYPYHNRRPQDENIDGGLIGQNAVHATRFIEHVAGTRIDRVAAFETTLGNPVAGGGLRMAASIAMTLANGGVATIVANYLNQPGFNRWGNEHLRIFGTKGFVESTDGGVKTRLVVGDEDRGPLDTSRPGLEYFDLVLGEILDGTDMPLTLEDELHPTRVVIRAKAAAMAPSKGTIPG